MKGFGTSGTPEMSGVRRVHCQAKAHELLKRLWVASPEEIDLAALAHLAGSLRIVEGGLDHADGRLVVPGPSGGTIRVKAGLNLGRRRFTIAHEIGHCLLHPRGGLDRDDTPNNFRIWNDPGEEAEANLFAAELLMPEFLFKPQAKRAAPSLAAIDRLSCDFSTSTMATAFQYATHTIEQAAVVVSVGGRVKWFHRAREFGPWIRTGLLHPHSGAGEIAAGKYGATKKMVPVPAYAWLPDYEGDDRKEVMEDSRYLDWYDCIVTLLWLSDDLEAD
jgi:hypothetical protein